MEYRGSKHGAGEFAAPILLHACAILRLEGVMSDEVQIMDERSAQVAAGESAEDSASRNLLRPLMAVRLGRPYTSLCAETAWVWQRARLICGQGE
jgi:hypothetical protein